jgi:hypothetical protein
MHCASKHCASIAVFVNVVCPLRHSLVLLKDFNHALPLIVSPIILSWYCKLTMQVAQRAEKGNDASIRLKYVSLIFAYKGPHIPFHHRTIYRRILLDVAWRNSSALSDVELIDCTGKR